MHARLLAGSALIAVLLGSPALAQTEAGPADAAQTAAEEDGADIVVTAAGRAQIVQEVPISVNVVGGDLVTRAAVVDVRGLVQLAPSLQATTGQSAATGTVLRIRGVGTAGDNPGFEPAVGVFIDGVFRPRAGVALAELPQLERVEVLRGPQGTLFGRNTSAGALSIITAGPAFNLAGYAEASYGNYDEVEFRAGITGPISETVAVRVDGAYHRRDGYITDINTGRRFNNLDRYFVRGQALFENDALRFRVIADYAETDEQCCAATNTNSFLLGLPTNPNLAERATFGAAAAATVALQTIAGAQGRTGVVVPYRPKARLGAYSPNRDLTEKVREYGLSGHLDYSISDDVNLTSISAYRNWRALRDQDIDFSGVDRAYRDDYRNKIESISQELRLNGTAFEDRIDWLVGAFYYREDLRLRDTVRFGNDASAYVDQFIGNLSRSAQLPNGFQVFGTRGGTVPTVGQVLLASNPALAAAAAGAGPAVLGTFLNPFAASPSGAGQVADDYRVRTNAFALFTHNIINITDQLSLTVGLRYNYEKKRISANLNSNSPTCAYLQTPQAGLLRTALGGLPQGLGAAILNLSCNPTINSEFNGQYRGNRSDEEFTGTAKLAYKVNDDVLLYGGYDRGFKSGGYNLDRATFSSRFLGGTGARIQDLSFRPETVDSYEIGIKTNFSRAFTFNATAFMSTFNDFQDLTFIGNNFRVTSIDKLKTKGIELESIIIPHPDLTLNFGYTFTKAEYRDDRLIAIPELADNNRRQLVQTPTSVVTAAMTYNPQLTDNIALLAYTDARFSSDYRTIAPRIAEQFTGNNSFAIVNARLGLQFMDKKLLVEGYVENLFNTYYNVTAFPIPEQSNNFAVYPGLPRFYGARVRYSF